MGRALVLAATLLTLGCGEEPVEEAEAPPARRRSPITGPALINQAERLQARACACTDAACAESALGAIGDFGRRYLAIEVEAEHEQKLKVAVNAALACANPLLQAAPEPDAGP